MDRMCLLERNHASDSSSSYSSENEAELLQEELKDNAKNEGNKTQLLSEVKSQVTQSLLAVGSSAASTTFKMSSSLTQAAVSVAAMERYNQDREEEEAKFVRLADFRRAEKEK